MTKDEALKLALEALQNSVDLVREDAYNAEKLYGNYPTRQGKVRGLKVLADDHENAITAIKQALAAPDTQRHNDYMAGFNEGYDRAEKNARKTTPSAAQPAPVKEPVAWMYESVCGNDFACRHNPPDYAKNIRPLYTTPPAQPAVQEPVWIQPDHLQKAKTAPFLCRVEPHKRDDFVPLYTTPPAAQPAVPEGWRVELADAVYGDVRLIAPNGEAWRFRNTDGADEFAWRFLVAMLTTKPEKGQP
jgi:hypothetical protein